MFMQDLSEEYPVELVMKIRTRCFVVVITYQISLGSEASIDPGIEIPKNINRTVDRD